MCVQSVVRYQDKKNMWGGGVRSTKGYTHGTVAPASNMELYHVEKKERARAILEGWGGPLGEHSHNTICVLKKLISRHIAP
jgi:hypothetical protein